MIAFIVLLLILLNGLFAMTDEGRQDSRWAEDG